MKQKAEGDVHRSLSLQRGWAASIRRMRIPREMSALPLTWGGRSEGALFPMLMVAACYYLPATCFMLSALSF